MISSMSVVGVLLIVLVIGIPNPAPAESAGSPAEQKKLTVTGVVEKLDLSAATGMLTTPTGKPVFFQIIKPELFQGISIGQQITIQMDEHGRAIKAIESQSIPELPAPAH
ncbi:MAG: hypothetical protein AB7G68_07090 [Nitrospiraceae bacterium]